LSGGQQQRVGVARALATKPNILLMDEPFGAVDPIVREELQDELVRIQRELKLTVLFVTHDRGEALKIADQLIVLSQQGTIEQAGTPRELTKKPANDFVRKILGV
jgi:osmoprotectant transport system ATP-binding protein